MNKYILPLLIGAGAIFYFSKKNKENNMPDRTDKFNEVKEPTQTTLQNARKNIKSKLKDFDINKAITNVSKLKNSKAFAVVKKAVAKRKNKKNVS
jgi:hypothetical protein